MFLTTVNVDPVPASSQHHGCKQAETASVPCVWAGVHLGKAQQSASQKADSRVRIWVSTVNAG